MLPLPANQAPCPCQSGKPFEHCCAPLIDGSRLAPDAQALMRSRYTAYCLQHDEYLLATWHPETRPENLEWEVPAVKWIGLQVRRFLPLDSEHAQVEFVARCRIGGRAQRLHELSRFVNDGGQWYYVDGEMIG